MKDITIKMLLNRIQYDVTGDLQKIKDFFTPRNINISFDIIQTDIKGYGVREVVNPFGNYQYVIDIDPVTLKSHLSASDDICMLVIEGFKEFGAQCPSESENKSFIPGTKTVFLSANADDEFYDTEPNFQIWLMHEIMHALVTIARSKGFSAVDCMDVMTNFSGQVLYYFMNYEPNNPNSNFINTMEYLEPWINSQEI